MSAPPLYGSTITDDPSRYPPQAPGSYQAQPVYPQQQPGVYESTYFKLSVSSTHL